MGYQQIPQSVRRVRDVVRFRGRIVWIPRVMLQKRDVFDQRAARREDVQTGRRISVRAVHHPHPLLDRYPSGLAVVGSKHAVDTRVAEQLVLTVSRVPRPGAHIRRNAKFC